MNTFAPQSWWRKKKKVNLYHNEAKGNSFKASTRQPLLANTARKCALPVIGKTKTKRVTRWNTKQPTAVRATGLMEKSTRDIAKCDW